MIVWHDKYNLCSCNFIENNVTPYAISSFPYFCLFISWLITGWVFVNILVLSPKQNIEHDVKKENNTILILGIKFNKKIEIKKIC